MPIIDDTAPVFKPALGQVLTRYVDLAKFLSLLSTQALFFTRVDKMEDQFEGRTPKGAYDSIFEFYRNSKDSNQTESAEEIVRQLIDYELKVREVVCISCWNRTEYESAALWKIYSDFGKGIMIKSSVQNMYNAFENAVEEIRISAVKYIDYSKQFFSTDNIYVPITHKRTAFEYESEVRLIHLVDIPRVGEEFPWKAMPIETGTMIKCDLSKLIDTIVIGPFSPPWMIDLIKDLISRYSLDKPVERSSLL